MVLGQGCPIGPLLQEEATCLPGCRRKQTGTTAKVHLRRQISAPTQGHYEVVRYTNKSGIYGGNSAVPLFKPWRCSSCSGFTQQGKAW